MATERQIQANRRQRREIHRSLHTGRQANLFEKRSARRRPPRPSLPRRPVLTLLPRTGGGILRQFQPSTPAEIALVNTMTLARWRRIEAVKNQTDCLNREMNLPQP